MVAAEIGAQACAMGTAAVMAGSRSFWNDGLVYVASPGGPLTRTGTFAAIRRLSCRDNQELPRVWHLRMRWVRVRLSP